MGTEEPWGVGAAHPWALLEASSSRIERSSSSRLGSDSASARARPLTPAAVAHLLRSTHLQNWRDRRTGRADNEGMRVTRSQRRPAWCRL